MREPQRKLGLGDKKGEIKCFNLQIEWGWSLRKMGWHRLSLEKGKKKKGNWVSTRLII